MNWPWKTCTDSRQGSREAKAWRPGWVGQSLKDERTLHMALGLLFLVSPLLSQVWGFT